MEYISRGQDLEGLIRENQLLRLANKRLNHLCTSLLLACSTKISSLLPSLPPFEPASKDIIEVANSFIEYLENNLTQSIDSHYNSFHHKLEQERANILKLEEKVQQYQTTVSQMSLIIQKLQIQLQENQMEVDQLRHQVRKWKAQSEKAQLDQAKWKGRYEYIHQRLESARDREEGHWTERDKLRQYS